jgi:uncharacterized protein (DUF427 family)
MRNELDLRDAELLLSVRLRHNISVEDTSERRRNHGTVMATRSVIPGAVDRFFVPEPLPKRLLYAGPLHRRMRVRFGGNWIADSENVILLFEPGHYPMAYFPETDISADTLQNTEYTSRHPELGLTSWYAVQAGKQSTARGAWRHIDLPAYGRSRCRCGDSKQVLCERRKHRLKN